MYLQLMYIHAIMSKDKTSSIKTLVADTRLAAECCIGLNARLAARRITRFFDARLAETGFSLAQFGLLIHIASARDDTIGSLAERSGLDQSTLSRNLRPLEAAGLIEIVTVEADLRRRAVWLTEQGARRLENAMTIWRAAHDALSELISPDQLRQLAARTEAI
jgi:DNA-binding MarR family transcriptional regulator